MHLFCARTTGLVLALQAVLYAALYPPADAFRHLLRRREAVYATVCFLLQSLAGFPVYLSSCRIHTKLTAAPFSGKTPHPEACNANPGRICCALRLCAPMGASLTAADLVCSWSSFWFGQVHERTPVNSREILSALRHQQFRPGAQKLVRAQDCITYNGHVVSLGVPARVRDGVATHYATT